MQGSMKALVWRRVTCEVLGLSWVCVELLCLDGDANCGTLEDSAVNFIVYNKQKQYET